MIGASSSGAIVVVGGTGGLDLGECRRGIFSGNSRPSLAKRSQGNTRRRLGSKDAVQILGRGAGIGCVAICGSRSGFISS